MNLTNVALVAPHLTASNHQRVLDEATHKRKSDVEHNIALRCRAHNVYEADQYFGPRESLFDSEVPAST